MPWDLLGLEESYFSHLLPLSFYLTKSLNFVKHSLQIITQDFQPLLSRNGPGTATCLLYMLLHDCHRLRQSGACKCQYESCSFYQTISYHPEKHEQTKQSLAAFNKHVLDSLVSNQHPLVLCAFPRSPPMKLRVAFLPCEKMPFMS